MNTRFVFYVGVDSGDRSYQVHILRGEDGKVVGEFTVEHDGRAISDFIDRLVKLSEGDPQRCAVSIEMPRGTLVESLLERGFPVFAINPKQLDRFRDRHTVAGAKDDRLDAFVLASSLRTDLNCFRSLRVDEPWVIRLRELSRMDGELEVEFRRMANRLRQQLHRYFPQLLRLSPAADEPWLWKLLQMAPTPHRARRLRAAQLKKLLRMHRIQRFRAEKLLSELKSPSVHLAAGSAEAASEHVGFLLPRLQLIHQQRKDCQRRMEELLEELPQAESLDQKSGHHDVMVIRSMPGIGTLITATVLAEASQPLAERDYHAVRAHSGVAPVTRRSGKSLVVLMRRGCNRRLQNAFYHWARVSVQRDLRCRTFYAACRARGHSHGRALRSLADRLLRILIAALQEGTLYDPDRSSRTVSQPQMGDSLGAMA